MRRSRSNSGWSTTGGTLWHRHRLQQAAVPSLPPRPPHTGAPPPTQVLPPGGMDAHRGAAGCAFATALKVKWGARAVRSSAKPYALNGSRRTGPRGGWQGCKQRLYGCEERCRDLDSEIMHRNAAHKKGPTFCWPRRSWAAADHLVLFPRCLRHPQPSAHLQALHQRHLVEGAPAWVESCRTTNSSSPSRLSSDAAIAPAPPLVPSFG